MLFVNKTHYDGREVRGVIARAAKDLEVYNNLKHWEVVVSLKNLNGYPYSGRCSYGIRRLTLCLAKKDEYPMESYNGYDRADMPDTFICENWQESLAAISGHELMHVRQWVRWCAGKKGNHRGRFNEIETQFAEYRAWKREHERTIRNQLKEAS